MIDPIGTFVGLAFPAQAALARFRRRNGVRTLFRLLHRDLAGRPGFPWDEVRGLAIDPTMQDLFIALLERHEIDDAALQTRVEQLCDPGSYRATRREFAEEVLASIRKNAHLAVPGDRDAQKHIAKLEADRVLQEGQRQHEEIVDGIAQLKELIQTGGDRPLGGPAFQPDLARLMDMALKHPPPPDIGEVITTLRESNINLAAQLLAFAGHDPAKAVELIRAPPPWFAGDSAAAWRAVGGIAMAAGRWEDAEQAFVNGERFPDADRVLMLLRARECARAAGRSDNARDYFDRAKTFDPDRVSVRVIEIRDLPDREQQLEELSRLQSTTQQEHIAIQTARAEALGLLERFTEAIEIVEALLRLDGKNLALLDRAAGLVVGREQRGIVAHQEPDRTALDIGARRSLEVRQQLRGRSRDDETGGLLARAIIAYSLAEDFAQGVALANREPSDGELASSQSRLALADAAMYARLPERALEILGTDEDAWRAQEQALAAQALVLADDPDGWHRGFSLAAEAFEDAKAKDAAAFALTVAGTRSADIEWREDAYDIIAATTPALAAYLRAERLDLEGEHERAEALLLPFAENPDALRGLIDRALAHENWRRALDLSEQLLNRSQRGADRWRRAMALKHLGRREALLEELRAITSDRDHPADVRGRAFEALVHETERTDYAELARLGQRWSEAVPGASRPFWLTVYAYGVLSRRDDALALLESGAHRPVDHQQARLAAQIYVRALPPHDACKRIVALSDQFERQDTWLEETIFFLSLRIEEPVDDPELQKRIRQASETFVSQASESDSTLVLEASGPEELIAQLAELDERRNQIWSVAAVEVLEGRALLANLARTGHQTVVDVLAQGFPVPLGFSSDTIAQAECAAARDALGTAVVWDPAALAVVAQLPEALRLRLKTFFPASVVATSTIQLCDNAEAAQAASEFDAVKVALDLARAWVPVPDIDPAAPTPVDQLLANDQLELNVRTVAASAGIAMRRGLPLYTDDRAVRWRVAQDQIPTFGTLALLEAAASRGLLSADEVEGARLSLLRRGALGLRATTDELAQVAGEGGEGVLVALRVAMEDHLAWRNDAGDQFRRFARLLRAIYDDRPSELEIWTIRLFATASERLPPTVDDRLIALVVLGTTWTSDTGSDDDAAFAIALFQALEAAPKKLGRRPFESLGVDIMEAFLGVFASPPLQGFVFRHFLRLLPHRARVEAIMSLMEPVHARPQKGRATPPRDSRRAQPRARAKRKRR
jgi:hypothetical protein